VKTPLQQVEEVSSTLLAPTSATKSVISRRESLSASCPLCPCKRTCSGHPDRSGLGRNQTSMKADEIDIIAVPAAPHGAGHAFQSLHRQAGLAQGVEVLLLSGRPSSRAEFSGVA
jgi:hypothetical protein